jgi:hypothetical protein
MVFAGCVWLVKAPVNGSIANLYIVLLLGATCMISLGLVVAARFSSEEFASGMINLLTWPMIFLSEAWFARWFE